MTDDTINRAITRKTKNLSFVRCGHGWNFKISLRDDLLSCGKSYLACSPVRIFHVEVFGKNSFNSRKITRAVYSAIYIHGGVEIVGGCKN